LWAVISATVGLILSAIRNRGGAVGSLAAGIAGTAWSLVTFFVIPVMIFEEKGVLTAIKNSVSLFKKTWGENIIGSIGIGLVMLPVILVFVAVFIAIIAASPLVVPLVVLFVVLLGGMRGALFCIEGDICHRTIYLCEDGNRPVCLFRRPYPGRIPGEGTEKGTVTRINMKKVTGMDSPFF